MMQGCYKFPDLKNLNNLIFLNSVCAWIIINVLTSSFSSIHFISIAVLLLVVISLFFFKREDVKGRLTIAFVISIIMLNLAQAFFHTSLPEMLPGMKETNIALIVLIILSLLWLILYHHNHIRNKNNWHFKKIKTGLLISTIFLTCFYATNDFWIISKNNFNGIRTAVGECIPQLPQETRSKDNIYWVNYLEDHETKYWIAQDTKHLTTEEEIKTFIPQKDLEFYRDSSGDYVIAFIWAFPPEYKFKKTALRTGFGKSDLYINSNAVSHDVCIRHIQLKVEKTLLKTGDLLDITQAYYPVKHYKNLVIP